MILGLPGFDKNTNVITFDLINSSIVRFGYTKGFAGFKHWNTTSVRSVVISLVLLFHFYRLRKEQTLFEMRI